MSSKKSSGEFSEKRRDLLRVLGNGAGCLAGASLLASVGCSEISVPTVVPLADLPIGQRVRVLDGENPVELVRNADGVDARSLWCTHTGCEVRWVADRQEYFCPCHDGVFDARGEVLAGPPPRALEPYPIQVTQTEVLLGVTSSEGGSAT